MEATTIIEPGSIVKHVDSDAYLYLVTVSSKKCPGAFNAYRIEQRSEEWQIVGLRQEFTSAESFEYAVADISILEKITMLNSALFETERLSQSRYEAVREWEQKWENANDALVEAAQENDLCEKFDEVAESIGMRGCKRDWEVTFTVSYDVTATVFARDEDAAREIVTDWEEEDYLNDRVEEAVRYGSPEIDVQYVEQA